MTELSLIAAADAELGIGKDGTIPWRLSADMRHFRAVTSEVTEPGRRNAVVMGRKTWESIPDKFRPLPGRLNVVITRSRDYPVPEGVVRASSLDDALTRLSQPPLAGDIERVFIGGGGQIYREAITRPECRRIYLTRIDRAFACDTFFPALPAEFRRIDDATPGREDDLGYELQVWERGGQPE